MILYTSRLGLRPLSVKDTEHIHELHALPETDEFNTLGIPAHRQATDTLVQEWLAKQSAIPRLSYIFCIEDMAAHNFIGLIAINLGMPKHRDAEVWYKIHRDYFGRGYTTEALIRLLHFGFSDLQLHRIEAGCAVENIASIRVLEKAGMIREGRKRKKLPIRGAWKDNYFYAILDEDFPEMH